MLAIKNTVPKIVALGLLLFCFLATGCGKEGMPAARPSLRDFAWKSTSAKKDGDCIIFSGTFEGSHQNLQQIRLDIAPVDSDENCPTCPFIAREIVFFSTRQAGYNEALGQVSFVFCPQKATAYRWRLAALSVYTQIPHSVSNIEIVNMEDDLFQ